MLEWPRLCQQVAAFASTSMGRAAVSNLPVPSSQAESEALIAETAAVTVLEIEYASSLDFGGISTDQVTTGRPIWIGIMATGPC